LELRGRQVDEPAHVAAAAGLERGGEPPELVDVRHPAGAAREREHVEVVAGPLDDTAQELVEPEAGRPLALRAEPGMEGAQTLVVGGRDARRGVVEGVPERAAALTGRQRQQGERVRGRADERRREEAEQRGLVAWVRERAEVAAQVLDLAASPPAPP